MSQLTQGKTRRLMYVEAKESANDRGDARIGWVTFSKSGRSIYYRGKKFQRIKGGGVSGNYFEVESGDEYWISGVKKSGSNRHWAGGGSIHVDEDARNEYEKVVAE
jgi:hypothetical protein